MGEFSARNRAARRYWEAGHPWNPERFCLLWKIDDFSRFSAILLAHLSESGVPAPDCLDGQWLQ
jgi:hypothetical protein